MSEDQPDSDMVPPRSATVPVAPILAGLLDRPFGRGDPQAQSPPPEPPHPNRHLWKIAATAASIAIMTLAVIVVVRTLTAINFNTLRGAIQATDGTQILLGGLFTALSYIALTGYDVVALRQLRLRVSYPTAALASFTSYAMSFTLGFSLITGGTVRYWIYSQAGVPAAKVASLTVIAGVTFWIGMGLLIGVALTLQPQAMSYVDHLSSPTNLAIGVGALLTLLVYLVWISRGHRRTHIQGLNLELPGLGLTLAQLFLGVTDLCAASAVLYFLLPTGHGMTFISFAATYVLACLLGLASNVPGGIGVFEATILNTVPSPSPEALLASLLLFRVMYYLVPFVLALALLGAHEIFRRWSSLRDEMSHGVDDDD